MIAVAILAGGSSTRFTLNKLLYPIKGKPLIQYVVDKIEKCKYVTKTVLVVTPLALQTFSNINLDVVIDFLSIGPLGGIYIVLKLFNEVMVVGGDMPFVNCEFINTMLNLCREYRYACLPIWRETGFMEPLAGVYSKDFISVLEKAITINEYSIQKLIRKFNLKVKTIDIEEHLRGFTDIFVSINKFEDINKFMEKFP
ncbi:MAG: molybdenum cofactor guanylyltransferase [Ignisphaera sp.]